MDLIKSGQFKLKAVSQDNNTPPPPTPASQLSHLDLIKAGNFHLKKVDRTERPIVKPKQEESKDPESLSIQDLLQKAATIRDAVACSDSDEEEEEESSSESW